VRDPGKERAFFRGAPSRYYIDLGARYFVHIITQWGLLCGVVSMLLTDV
jgi:hypothetical protein